MSLSEEEIRSKVHTVWLSNHGFTSSDFILEYGFEVALGCGKIRRPRSDILVKSLHGNNLFLIECKAQHILLNDKARDQAISYAGLLMGSEGGIPPFVIVSNGQETKIYDSMTRELMDDENIPKTHPHALSGFKVISDDLTLRTEFLERLISLSPENLLAFCEAQVSTRMKLLKSEDISGGKKYIPSLYIEREEANIKLKELLEKKQRSVVLLQGVPQIGKTNFICATVEKYLERGEPCLFYPAVSLQDDLLKEICNDFEWAFGGSSDAYQLINNRLEKILQSTSKCLTIFIDGWNEASLEVARNIDFVAERLAKFRIRIVISMTNTAADRLLFDSRGNPSRIADAVSLSVNEISSIELNPGKTFDKWSVIYLPSYSREERGAAYRKYSSAYQVDMTNSDNENISDPFLLRIAMENYSGGKLPSGFLHEPTLIKESLDRKAERIMGFSKPSATKRLLTKLSDIIYVKDFPVLEDLVLESWGMPLNQSAPEEFLEAALLSKSGKGDGSFLLDFYYGRERNFVISYWLKKWPDFFEGNINNEELVTELKSAFTTQAGKEAILWFLCLPKSLKDLKRLLEDTSVLENEYIFPSLIRCLGNVIDNNQLVIEEKWIHQVIQNSIQSIYPKIKIEAIKVLALLSEEPDEIIKYLHTENEGLDKDLVIALLSIENDYPISAESASSNVFLALTNYHHEMGYGNSYDDFHDQDSELLLIFEELQHNDSDNLCIAASKVYGHIAPFHYMQTLLNDWITPEVLNSKTLEKSNQASGLREAIGQIEDLYYGDMCIGMLDGILEDPEYAKHEYSKLHELFMPIVQASSQSSEESRKLLSLLDNFEAEQNELISGKASDTTQYFSEDKLQLKLPLD